MEELILSHLIKNEKYSRQVLPYLNEELFHDKSERTTFNMVKDHIEKYNALPTKEILYIDLGNLNNIDEHTFEECKSFLQTLSIDETTKLEWLIDQTETFVQDRSVHNAIRESIKILDKSTDKTKDAIPGILQDALAVSFDAKIGHDFLDDTETRFDLYHTHQTRIPSRS